MKAGMLTEKQLSRERSSVICLEQPESKYPKNNWSTAFIKREDGTLEKLWIPNDWTGFLFQLPGLGVSFSRVVGFLRGTSVVVVILVKGHAFPTMVKVRPVGCDLLALVDSFTPIEDDIGLLETRFDVKAIFVIVYPEDVSGLVNLTVLSLFFGVTATNFPSVLLILGQVLLRFISNS
ncbi:hypothetical protein Tco_1209770 [Tanacetum coccineum]